MFKITVTGLGAEITQGFLPIETVESIYEDMDNNLSLEDYLLESLSDPNKLDWTDIDDVFHDTGAYTSTAVITVNGMPYDLHEFTVEEEILAEDFEIADDIRILTCIDESKGNFFSSEIEDMFDSSLLKIKTKSIKSYSIITDLEYDGRRLINQSNEPTLSKNFIAILEE